MAAPFRPDRVAYFEAQGWRAYYDHKWPRLLKLMVSVCHEQFSMPWPKAIQGAYYVTRASVAWVPIDHDERKVLHYYEAFYRMARRYSGLVFDTKRVAELELRYNDDHRRLVDLEDKQPLLDTLTQLHSLLFALPEAEVRESAEWRLKALNTVDSITQHTPTDVEGDWLKLEDELRRCYRSIAEAVAQRARVRSTA